jgi:Spy/CpxP family protein refolding chaperone
VSVAAAGPPGQSGSPPLTPPGTPPGTPTGWLSRRVLIVLLAISVVLNLCFVAGAAWSWWRAPVRWVSMEQRYQQMAGELDLTPQQKTGFDAYVAAMRARTEKMRQQVGQLMGSAWDEIAKPQADEAQVMRLFDEAGEKRREFQREAGTQTLKFLAVLTPEQRSKFVAIARERRGSWQRFPSAAR